MIDFGLVSQIQGMFFSLQKMAVGGMVLVIVFVGLRAVLSLLLSFSLGQFAGLVAGMISWCIAIAVFAHPDIRTVAINFSYALACSLGLGDIADISGVSGGLGIIDNLASQLNQMLGAFPF